MFVELLKAWRMCFLCRDVALDVGDKINLTFTFLLILRLFNQQGKSIFKITIGFVKKYRWNFLHLDNIVVNKYSELVKQFSFTIDGLAQSLLFIF